MERQIDRGRHKYWGGGGGEEGAKRQRHRGVGRIETRIVRVCARDTKMEGKKKVPR